ncbi:hypothetical protein [Rhizobium leguminosarum]|uniref:hypothetical protein n=1 Tax=Rhizobium leguminosarum TaxID=384 RepID=UPI001C97A1BC|nr:hypothetical protein [Rhizobium leguminosarum]MBY5515643.1 hypothetical protein [Rhizobium leguminosarum]
MRRIGIGVVLLLVVLGLGYLLLPSDDICADKVRGFAKSAASSVEGTREALSKISATLKTDQAYRAEQSFANLKPADFAVLRACDTQCALLTRCLRFVIFSSPSQACPREYEDFQKKGDAAAKVLAELEQTRTNAAKLVPESEKVRQLKTGIAELEQSSVQLVARSHC